MIDSDLSEQFDEEEDLIMHVDTLPSELSTAETAETASAAIAHGAQSENRSEPIAIPGRLSRGELQHGIDSVSLLRSIDMSATLLEGNVRSNSVTGLIDNDASSGIFNHQYFMERLQLEIELRALEDEQFNRVLLESRDEFDATDMIKKNESAVLNSRMQKYSTVKIKKKRGE